MKSVIKKLLVVTAVSPLIGASAFAQDKSIYGTDDRLDYFQASGEMQQLADSVVSLWESKNVIASGPDFNLNSAGFGATLDLCPTERFREQPIGAFCSGTLVGEDIIMTAGHCVPNRAKCEDTKFVFGYAVRDAGGTATTTVPASEVYGCKKIIKRAGPTQSILGTITTIIGALTNRMGADYALVKLDRKVSGHTPLPVNRAAGVSAGDPIFVIGHPVGLPLKVAGNARVRSTSAKNSFSTDLDTFGGNSGSAVFNARTKLIEGILVRGGTDFARTASGCVISVSVGQDQGRGEDVTKISVLSKRIPRITNGTKGTSEIVSMDPSTVSGPETDLSERMTLSFE